MSPAGGVLWFQRCLYDLGPQEMGCVALEFCNDIPHDCELVFFSKGIFPLAGDALLA